jgi:hypothetical protein
MTGLDLVTFLRLLRTDLAAWTGLAVVGSVLALSLWTSFRGRRMLRRCVAVSLLAHAGALVTGGQTSWGQHLLSAWDLSRLAKPDEAVSFSSIEVAAEDDLGADAEGTEARGLLSADEAEGGTASRTPSAAPWDVPGMGRAPLAAVGPDRQMRPSEIGPAADLVVREPAEAPVPVVGANPTLSTPAAEPPAPRNDNTANPPEPAPAAAVAAVEVGELPRVGPLPTPTASGDAMAGLRTGARASGRVTPRASEGRSPIGGSPVAIVPSLPVGPLVGRPTSDALVGGMPDAGEAADGPEGLGPTDLLGLGTGTSEPRPGAPRISASPVMPGREGLTARPSSERPADPILSPRPGDETPVAIARALPDSLLARPAPPRASRTLPEVPEVYRPRLDRAHSARAQRAGASAASEQAVERALDWLARHQDDDGRWDAATGLDNQGRPAPGHDDFTKHCPPGEVCFGTCHYYEADTAMTGLALLAYLGAGYTHQDGKHASTVGRGLDFLRAVQKPDGDLRGDSRAVGMYCHAMAALALCEAYALTGDAALRDPASRGVDFLVKARARDHMAWRYEPGAPIGDTSILGWVILVLKSAREIGFAVPQDVTTGASRWLRMVAAGDRGGLAIYQPGHDVTETMTAEAWVCRQFLGIGGPGSASSEAARYLLAHPPSKEFNIYYYYYATLAMFQHGGPEWDRWNALLRDELVRRQRTSGHMAGSWDPDNSKYGQYGGRIYTTALATLSLEVYYRYLRLYDDDDDARGSR